MKMRPCRTRLFALAALGAFTLLAGATGALAQSDQITTDQTLDDCKLIPDDGARLACYDRVMKAGRENVPGLAPAPAASAAPATPAPVAAGGGAGSAGAPATASPPLTPAQEAQQQKAEFGLPKNLVETASEKKLKQVRLEIASIGEGAAGQLVISTTDGQVWAQTNGAPPQRQPKPGGFITIKRNIMGGMVCKTDKYSTFDCMRTDRPQSASGG
jgi:hypothetical protein